VAAATLPSTAKQVKIPLFLGFPYLGDDSASWSSEDQPILTINGRSYKPIKKTADISSGIYFVTLNCLNEIVLSMPESSSEVVGDTINVIRDADSFPAFILTDEQF
jgi:hypothetical protein